MIGYLMTYITIAKKSSPKHLNALQMVEEITTELIEHLIDHLKQNNIVQEIVLSCAFMGC